MDGFNTSAKRDIRAYAYSIALHMIVFLAVAVMSAMTKETKKPVVIDLRFLEAADATLPNVARPHDVPAPRPASPAREISKKVVSEPPQAVGHEPNPQEPASVTSEVVPEAAQPPVAAPAASALAVVSRETVSKPPEVDYSFIKDAVQNKIKYPHVARSNGWEGRVIVSFVIECGGGVRDIRVKESSGIALLDKSAVDAVKNAGPFKPVAIEARVVIPVVYKLNSAE